MRESIISDRRFVATELCTKCNTWNINRTVTEIVIVLDKARQ